LNEQPGHLHKHLVLSGYSQTNHLLEKLSLVQQALGYQPLRHLPLLGGSQESSMERGGCPHPDTVSPPTEDEGYESYLDMGEQPPFTKRDIGCLVIYYTEWGKVEVIEDDIPPAA